jgi:hypothetical protein
MVLVFFTTNMGSMKKGSPLFNQFYTQGKVPPKRSLICLGPLLNTPWNHCMNPQLCLSIPSKQYTHHGPYERNCPYLWPPFDPINLSWALGQNVKVQALESIKDLFRHKNSLRLHFAHRRLTHFSGFLRFCHTFFGSSFNIEHGAYWWSSYLGKHIGCIGHYVFMCHLSTFLSHLNNTSSFFLLIFLANVNKWIMQVCGDIMGLRLWEFIQGSLMRCQA